MTVLLAAVMLLTTMLPLTASAASGVTMDLTDCHVSWDYTLTDEEGNTFSAAYGLKAADDIYFGKGFSPYLSKMHDYTAKRKGLTGSKADWEYGRDYVYCFCILTKPISRISVRTISLLILNPSLFITAAILAAPNT